MHRLERGSIDPQTWSSLVQAIARIGSWHWSVESDVLRASPELVRLFDLPVDAFRMDEWLARIHRDDLEATRAALYRCVSEGVAADARFRVVRSDGSVAHVHARGQRMGGTDGSPLRVIGISQDVTDQVVVEQLYRDLVAQVPGVVWRADSSGRIVFVSGKVEELTGYSADQIRSAGEDFWVQTIEAQDLASLPALWQSLIDGGSFETEFRLRRSSGDIVWVHLRAGVVDNDGVKTIVGVATDVTGRRTAEEALRASEARYRMLVEQAKDIIVSIDLEGRVQALNRAAEEVTGGSRVEWIGRSIFDALTPESARVAREQFAAVVGGEEPASRSEYELRTRRGRPVTVEAEIQAVRSGSRVAGLVMVARDVTARKEADARAEREKRLASLGQLATSVAHEFNNVLMSIMPFAELMQRRAAGDQRTMRATTHIIDAVRRGREISQEILRFARPAPAELVPLVVAEWAFEFQKKAEAILGPSYTVTTEMPEHKVTIAADRLLLDQVAVNLTLNARDAMPGGGSLTISVRADGGSASIDFTDTGCGIAPELFDRVFEPLYTTKRDGNGLGLSIAHQAMVQQNGSIHLRSVAGEGTTFTLSFLEAEAAVDVASGQRTGFIRRVLIVEDDVAVGEGLRLLLEDQGLDVKLVERGVQALPAIEIFQPDVVLLDVNLPDLNGLDVYTRIRESWPSLPVIFSTGHADARALAEVRGMVPSIMKPYDLEQLMTLMAEVTT